LFSHKSHLNTLIRLPRVLIAINYNNISFYNVYLLFNSSSVADVNSTAECSTSKQPDCIAKCTVFREAESTTDCSVLPDSTSECPENSDTLSVCLDDEMDLDPYLPKVKETSTFVKLSNKSKQNARKKELPSFLRRSLIRKMLLKSRSEFANMFSCYYCHQYVTTPVKFPGCPHYFDLLCIDNLEMFCELPVHCVQCKKTLYTSQNAFEDLTVITELTDRLPTLLSMSHLETASYRERLGRMTRLWNTLQRIRDDCT